MRWIGIAAQPYRRPLEELLNTYTVAESFLWVERPEEIRRIFLQAMPGECNALVGPDATNGVPINLAAALAEDGHANAVVVAQPEPSGSFRSRAKQAGIASVIDITSIKNQLEPFGCTSRNRLSVLYRAILDRSTIPLNQSIIPVSSRSNGQWLRWETGLPPVTVQC